ncbi:serine/threonine-protein kinase [Streptomyces lonegramiae]|uniref:non-specific serine/threonine protein kinase n=1 Tax=Streptomyces lonegramiae TaxID=3075524 RepID=A0ABU2XB23_9ACTN|nr:serine/threonine-protein kinase [Streptomyces sp. DSM 41529]MDT0542745.1 serine/threonine-protein kinase [Streptomyces sp. DSM 41529]
MAETRLIQGRYRLLDLIGRGGMGEVWRALDESLGRRVAVKCLKPMGQQRDPSFMDVLRERFRREARVAASLQHRGVTVVHDFGEHEGVLYLVMELLEGRNLSQLLEDNERRPLPVPDVLDMAGQLAVALAYTHDQGIVHRDLKPANIMRLADGSVKICDFGIARLGHDIDFTARLTGTGIAMGTPHYMSPEQIADGSVDHRSDLYSLGCVLYELATGAPPFHHDDAWAVLVGHRDTPPEPPRRHRPEIPELFERAILDLLAKDPEDRPRDASDLAKRIALARATWGAGQPLVPEWTLPGPGAGLPAGLPARRPPQLPDWARHMTAGTAADPAGRAVARPAPPGEAAALTGAWTGGGAGAGGLTGAWAGGPAPPLAAPPLAPAGEPPPPSLLAALAVRHTVGMSLALQGRWEEAGRTHREVAAERERVLGPDHPDTLVTRYEVAYALGRLGRWSEALHIYREVADARGRTLGREHPDALAARYEVGISLGRLGRSAEALALYRALVDDRTRAQGPTDPETLRARHGLGVNLGRLGRWEEALAEARDVSTLRERTLGPDHPDTLVSCREVAVALGWLGNWTDALELYRRVARAREDVLGADHPDALASLGDEAQCLEQLGRREEAVELYRRMASARRRQG